MKKNFLATLVTGFFLVGMVGMAQADMYVNDGGYVNVGEYDKFIAKAAKADLHDSGDATELAWINDTVGTEYTMAEFTKFDSPAWLNVYSETTGLTLQTPESYAFALNDKPDYFLVKTGKNSTNDVDERIFLFANNNNFDYAVFRLQFGGQYYIKNFGALSHSAQVGSNGGNGDNGENAAPVPEPATMVLLGVGLFGVIGASRRRKKK